MNQNLIDQTVLSSIFGRHEEITIRVFGNCFNRLSCVFGKDYIQPFPDFQDLPGMDLYVDRLTLAPPSGWCSMILEFGSEKRLPLSPAESSTAPKLAARPTQIVEIAGFT